MERDRTMDPQPTPTTTARGIGRFVLGQGPGGTCGDVELVLDVFSGASPSVEVGWAAPAGCVPDEAAAEIVAYLQWYLEDYLERFPVAALRATVVAAGWSDDRRNEPERAAFLAIHHAMTRTTLPPRPLFEAPDRDEPDPAEVP